jgi:SnoaL-like domain
MNATEDRLAIHEVIARHGHLFDAGEFDRLEEIFTFDIRYDVADMGGGVLEGIPAIIAAARALGDQNPLAHHVTNIVVETLAENSASARSKGFGVMTDGTTGTVTYADDLVRTPVGWRIRRRVVRLRRRPLTA